MKRIVILIILALSASHMLAAPTPQELFAAGNEAYQAKDYATAARHYQSVIDHGYTSATLLYNLGNALYRQGDYAHAILYFERAHRLAPNDSEITENLELAQSKTQDKIEAIPEFFLSRWFHAVVSIASPKGWQIIILSVVALLLAAVVTIMLGRSYTLRKWSLVATLVLVVLLICSIANATYSANLVSNTDEAVIIPTMVSVKGSPETSSVDKFVLHAGTKVRIDEEVGDWLKITIADGNKGWVAKHEIERI